MEHLRRVNRLWASDSMHLRKLLLIPIPAPLDGTVIRSRSENGSPGLSNGSLPPSESTFRNSNFPAGSRENPLSKAEALALLKTYESDTSKDHRPGTPESSSSSEINAPSVVEKTVSPSDFFTRMDQSIASCRKNTEHIASNWRLVGVSHVILNLFRFNPKEKLVRILSNGAWTAWAQVKSVFWLTAKILLLGVL